MQATKSNPTFIKEKGPLLYWVNRSSIIGKGIKSDPIAPRFGPISFCYCGMFCLQRRGFNVMIHHQISNLTNPVPNPSTHSCRDDFLNFSEACLLLPMKIKGSWLTLCVLT
jgi:hypothetical protein